jgi:hypothetical protein
MFRNTFKIVHRRALEGLVHGFKYCPKRRRDLTQAKSKGIHDIKHRLEKVYAKFIRNTTMWFDHKTYREPDVPESPKPWGPKWLGVR